MKFIKTSAVAVLLAFSFTAYGQLDDLAYSSYYYDYKLLNPALAGVKDKHIITTVYSGVPSSSWPSHLLYGTYETSIPSIKSGIGALAAHEELGAITIIQGGLFFNRKLAFNDRSGLRVGTRLSYRHTKIDYSFFRPIDPADPITISGTEIGNRFNFDLGLLYYSPIVNIGLSIQDILQQDEQNRELNVIVFREFNITNGLKISPSVVYMTGFDWHRVDINSVFEIKEWVLVGAGYASVDGSDGVSFNAGINVKDWVQVITHIYSSTQDRLREYTGSKLEVIARTNIPHPKSKK